jgi:hypothetical protein
MEMFCGNVSNGLCAVTFVNIEDPYNMEATPEPEPQAGSSPIIIHRAEERIVDGYSPFDDATGLEALSTAATSNYDYIRPLYVNSIESKTNKRY